MISSRADFFFRSPLESELEDGSFLFTDAAALRAPPLRTALKRDTNCLLQVERIHYLFMKPAQRPVYLDLEGPAIEEEAPRLKATAREKQVRENTKKKKILYYENKANSLFSSSLSRFSSVKTGVSYKIK